MESTGANVIAPIIDHAIIYDVNPSPEKTNMDRQIIMNTWRKCDSYIWNWKPKKNAIDFVTRETIQYVSGYVTKKLYGELGKAEYDDLGREAPFLLASQGIGKQFALEHSEEIKNRGFMYYNGHKVRIPKYYRDLLGIRQTLEDSESWKVENMSAESKKQYYEKCNMDSAKFMLGFRNWFDRHKYPKCWITDIKYNSRLEELVFTYADELQFDYSKLIFKQSGLSARKDTFEYGFV